MNSKYDFEQELIFSGEKKILSQNFTNGKLTVVCGGADFDLRQVTPKTKDVKLEISCILGGVRLILPEDWEVVTNVKSYLAGVDSVHKVPSKAKVTLHITGEVILGGIAII